jgi:hypothetical protein
VHEIWPMYLQKDLRVFEDWVLSTTSVPKTQAGTESLQKLDNEG